MYKGLTPQSKVQIQTGHKIKITTILEIKSTIYNTNDERDDLAARGVQSIRHCIRIQKRLREYVRQAMMTIFNCAAFKTERDLRCVLVMKFRPHHSANTDEMQRDLWANREIKHTRHWKLI